MDELYREDALPVELPGQLTFVPEPPRSAENPAKHSKYDAAVSSEVSLENPVHITILLCDILAHFDGRLPADWLYEICVGAGHLNYFLYCSAVDDLLAQGSAEERTDASGIRSFALTKKGRSCAEKLRRYVPKYFRDQVMLTALRYVHRQKALRDMKITYEQHEKDWSVCLTCCDCGREMFFLRIHAPGQAEAEALGERILRNPAGFFGKVLDLALNNEEVQFDLTDN